MEKQFRYGLTILLSTVAILQFVQVIWRYILQAPLMGLDDILIYPTLWLYLLGAVNASREDTQIKANVLDVFLKTDRSKLGVRIVADVMTVTVSAWLTFWAWDYFRYASRVWKETPTIYLPTFYAECSLFLGLLLMTLFGLYHLLKNVRRFTLLSTKPVTTSLHSANEGSA